MPLVTIQRKEVVLWVELKTLKYFHQFLVFLSQNNQNPKFAQRVFVPFAKCMVEGHRGITGTCCRQRLG
uniref:Bm1653 n=1 Tax=Brugia malayi TaxID=6279 RepID=A0A1I9G6C1_BRUMA|nr:Bm1653 [Brugia malayi]